PEDARSFGPFGVNAAAFDKVSETSEGHATILPLAKATVPQVDGDSSGLLMQIVLGQHRHLGLGVTCVRHDEVWPNVAKGDMLVAQYLASARIEVSRRCRQLEGLVDPLTFHSR